MKRTVRCRDCGARWSSDRGAENVGECVSCGGRNCLFQVEVTDQIGFIGGITVVIGVTNPDRDYRRRLEESVLEVEELERGLATPGSRAALAANRRLHHVFVDLWSLREAVIQDGRAVPKTVDEAIDASPSVLALAHDLGNLAKHGKLARSRSGDVPRFGAVSLETSDGETWRLVSIIEHGTIGHNGLVVARQAIELWRGMMTEWGLL